jgi:addiction module HigA family antidote
MRTATPSTCSRLLITTEVMSNDEALKAQRGPGFEHEAFAPKGAVMKIFENNQQAAHVFHPGLIIADEIETLGLSPKKASLALGITQTDLQKLCNGTLDITPGIAAGLEQLGSGEADFWLRLQQQFNVHPKRGGFRAGSGRKKKHFVSKQVRISAPEAQPNTSTALAELILQAPVPTTAQRR